MMDDMEIEDDPVIRELNVFVSNELRQQLYLLQYPMRPIERALPDPSHAKIKPSNKMLEVSHLIKQSGKNYDPSAPEHLLLEEKTHCANPIEVSTNYVVGVIKDNEFHLTPLHGIMQMRPAFKHIDAQAAIEDPDDDVVKPVNDAPLQVTFKRKETERATEARQRSYAYKRDREESEKWIDLSIHDAESIPAREEFEKMFCEKRNREIKFKCGAAAYLKKIDHLHPSEGHGTGLESNNDRSSKASTHDSNDAPRQEFINPRAYMIPLSVSELTDWKGVQSLKAYVRKAVIISHEMLREVSDVHDDKVIIEDLKEYALFLRGNWVVRSEVVYPTDNLAFGAQDAALVLLHFYGAIRRNKLQALVGVTSAVLKTILESVSVLDRRHKCWALKVEDTFSLTLSNPFVAIDAESLWIERRGALVAQCSEIEFDECGFQIRPPYMSLVSDLLSCSKPSIKTNKTIFDPHRDFDDVAQIKQKKDIGGWPEMKAIHEPSPLKSHENAPVGDGGGSNGDLDGEKRVRPRPKGSRIRPKRK